MKPEVCPVSCKGLADRMLDISVIIVNWKAGPMLVNCLRLIVAEIGGISSEYIIIDNSSADHDVDMVRREFSGVKIISNMTNLGFAKAVNQGILASSGRYLLLINPDAFVAPGIIASVISFLDSRPEVGILGPRVLNADGSLQGSARAYPHFATAFFGRTSLMSRLFPSNGMTRRQVLCFKERLRRPSAVDWVSGACMFVRREVFEDIGLFDEQFFLFWEDADICWRAHDCGWPVIYYPDAFVTHLIGGCSQHAAVRSLLAFHVSAFRLYRIHVTRSLFHPLNLVAAAGLSIHFVSSLAWLTLRQLSRRLTSGHGVTRVDQIGSQPIQPETEASGL